MNSTLIPYLVCNMETLRIFFLNNTYKNYRIPPSFLLFSKVCTCIRQQIPRIEYSSIPKHIHPLLTTPQSTQSARLSLQSSELAPPPLPEAIVCPPLWNQRVGRRVRRSGTLDSCILLLAKIFPFPASVS
jgi:hypothetical protein